MPRKTKPLPTTLVTLLLDRSGSMETIKAATIEGFNAYVAGLKAETKAKIEFTFLQFDSNNGTEIDKIYVAEPIGEVAELNNSTFQPRGGTPLIEAAFKTIKATEVAIDKRDEKPKVVVCIQTDGQENSSYGFSWEALSALVKQKTEEGWQFNFMGAGIDAYDQGAKMGISTADTVSYDSANMESTYNAFAATASNTVCYAGGQSANTSYSMAQKVGSGDKFDPTVNLANIVITPVGQTSSTNSADLDVTK